MFGLQFQGVRIHPGGDGKLAEPESELEAKRVHSHPHEGSRENKLDAG